MFSRHGRGVAEVSGSIRVLGQGLIDVSLAEVGPEGVREDVLRVGGLPEQEVGNALISTVRMIKSGSGSSQV